jgi:hypothetical protein
MHYLEKQKKNIQGNLAQPLIRAATPYSRVPFR